MSNAGVEVLLLRKLFLVVLRAIHTIEALRLLIELLLEDVVVEEQTKVDQSFVGPLEVDVEIDAHVEKVALHIAEIRVSPDVKANFLVDLTNIAIFTKDLKKLLLETCESGDENQIQLVFGLIEEVLLNQFLESVAKVRSLASLERAAAEEQLGQIQTIFLNLNLRLWRNHCLIHCLL